MERITLAYSIENRDQANLIDKKLSRSGIVFDHITEQNNPIPGQFTAAVMASGGQVILLVTDNFLRSETCLAGALPMIQQLSRANRLIPVVADGLRKNENSGILESVETKFERVIHAILYMNFWQSVYLELRQKTDYNVQTEPGFEGKVRNVRDISNEIGDILNALRNADCLHFDQFSANNYEQFFKKSGLGMLHANYQLLSVNDNDTDFWQAPPRANGQIAMPHFEVEKPVFEEKIEEYQPAESKTIEEKTPENPPIPEAVPPVFEVENNFENEEKIAQVTDNQLFIDDFEIQLPDKKSSTPPPIYPILDPEKPMPSREEIEEIVARTVREEQEKLTAGETLPEQNRAKVSPVQVPNFEPQKLVSEKNEDYKITLADAGYWLERNRFEEATIQIEELLLKHPKSPDGYSVLGQIAERSGDFEAARTHYEKVLLLDPYFEGGNLQLARLLDRHFRFEKKEAVRHFRAAAKLDSTNSEATYRAAVLLLENLSKPEKAAKYFEKTVERQPDHALAWYDLAHLQKQLGETVKARFSWQKAIALNPAWQNETMDKFFGNSPKIEEHEIEKPTQLADNQLVTPVIEENFEKPNLPEKQILTVLITGATSGIGRATAEIFARNGHRVLATGRRADRLTDMKNDFLEKYSGEIEVANFDVRDRSAVATFYENLPENWQNIDILINNAGLAKGLDPIHEADFEHWEQMIDTNLKGLLYMTRLFSPKMVERRKGHIINLGSIAGKEIYPKGSVYNATKFAVDALTRSMRLDLAPHGLKVSSVSPGAVEETEFSLVRYDGDAEKAKIYEDYVPLNSRDVAETIYFIATRPPHVAIHDIVLTGRQQASALQITRDGRY